MKKFLSVLDYVVIVTTILALLLVSAGTVLIPITGSEAYYKAQYRKNGTLQTLPYTFKDPQGNSHVMAYTEEELDEITRSIIDYLLGGKESMQVTVTRDGMAYDVFSTQALKHMADVKVLYTGGIRLGIAALVVFLFGIAYFIVRRKTVFPKWFKTTVRFYLCIVLVLAVAAVFIFADFDNAFVEFHRIIFPDETKFRDAFFGKTSNYPEKYYIDNLMLVNILTADLFQDAGLICAGVVIAVLTAYTLIAYYFSPKKKAKRGEKNG